MSNECMSLPPLKPCPFCGERNPYTRRGKFVWWVACCNEGCLALGGCKRTKKDAIEAWNRRVGESNE